MAGTTLFLHKCLPIWFLYCKAKKSKLVYWIKRQTWCLGLFDCSNVKMNFSLNKFGFIFRLLFSIWSQLFVYWWKEPIMIPMLLLFFVLTDRLWCSTVLVQLLRQQLFNVLNVFNVSPLFCLGHFKAQHYQLKVVKQSFFFKEHSHQRVFSFSSTVLKI